MNIKINGAKLREIREEKHYTVKEVSEHIGYASPQVLRNLENGTHKSMRPDRFRALIDILYLTEDEKLSIINK